MKTQVRKNILTHMYNVQVQDTPNSWRSVESYDTKEEAEERAFAIANGDAIKSVKPKEKSAQNAKKTAKKGKNAKAPKVKKA